LISPCLWVSLPEIEIPPHLSVAGTVARELLSEEPVWVRLVGMYSDFNSAALVDQFGSFSFKAVRPGRHYLMLFANGKLRIAGEISLSQLADGIRIQPGSVTSYLRD